MSSLSQQRFFDELKSFKQRFDDMKPVLELTVRDDHLGIEGYVVVWNTDISKKGPLSNNGNGCGKGGTRVKNDLCLNDVKRMARAMAKKTAAAGLPLGGAKSGLRTSPDDPDYEKKWKRFVQLVKDAGVLIEDGGVFGGFGYDIGGKPPLNALWTIEQLGSGHCFTGKPIDHGGTDYDKIGIAGLGVAEAGKTLLKLKAHNHDPSYAVQGMGAMGSAVTRYFDGRLKVVSDIHYGGTWVFDDHASNHFILSPTLENLEKEAQKISDDPAASLYADVDIVFPCALEDTLTKDNAHLVKAPYIVEGANNPTTDEAYQILFDRNILIVPGIIANAGGIIAAFVEMTSKAGNKSEEAIALTKDRVSDNIKQVMRYVDDLNVRPDLAADYITYKTILNKG